MKKKNTFALACITALICSGCGSIESNTVNTDEVRVTENTAAPVVTTAVQSEDVNDNTIALTEATDSSAVTEVQTKPSVTTTTENVVDKPSTIALGGDTDSKSTGRNAQQANGGTITLEASTTTTRTDDGGYHHDQPMGNEVLPQSVDYYTTDTQPQQTQPPVTEQPAPQETQQTQDGGYTSKGYKVEIKDGVTYVGGVIIANKSYKLPENYGNGLNEDALSAFYQMQSAAANDGIWLSIVSGYRSYWYQDQLYWGYVAARGSQEEVDRFSARAGYSEHQTGLAMDLNNASRSFAGTPEAYWIEQHCADYGFILRYPDGKEDITGFMYEPWHIRYVGNELARTLTDQGLTLEEYFGIDSVYSGE